MERTWSLRGACVELAWSVHGACIQNADRAWEEAASCAGAGGKCKAAKGAYLEIISSATHACESTQGGGRLRLHARADGVLAFPLSKRLMLFLYEGLCS